MALGASEIPLDANGVVADAYLTAYKLTGHSEYREIGKNVLAMLGVVVKAFLLEDGNELSATRVADSVFYMRAYGRLVGMP